MAQPYHTLQQLLDKVGAEVTPAFVHGLWCGRSASGDQFANDQWWLYTLKVLEPEHMPDENLKAAFKAVAGFTQANLEQDNLSFTPWLPEDSTACSVRVAALSEWCLGFIEGLTSCLGASLGDVDPEVKETVQDMLEIGEVDARVDGSQEDERQLFELTEFVKVAALNTYLTLKDKQDNNSGSAPGTPTLH